MTTKRTTKQTPPSASPPPPSHLFEKIFMMAGTGILIFSLTFFFAISAKHETQKDAETKKIQQQVQQQIAEYVATHTPQPSTTEPVVLQQCIAPCSRYVGWKQRVAWPEGFALNIKYNGINHFVEFADMEGKNLNLADRKELSAKFQPGDAEFAFPTGQHLLVQVYDK
jgi:hypothetical protein